MKNRSVTIRVCIYLIMMGVLIFLEQKISNVLVKILCTLFYIIISSVLISWRTYDCLWVCDECDEKFEISLGDSIKSLYLNCFKNKLYYRKLNCPKCKKKTWSRCNFKECKSE